MAILMAAAAFTSSAGKAWSDYQQGQEARNMAIRNAEEMQQQAKEAVYNAGQEVNAADYKAAHLIARMSATSAATGIDESSGSSKLAITESAEQQKLNDMYTRYAGKVAASGLDYNAITTKVQGEEAAQAGVTQAITGLITGGIQSYGIYKGGGVMSGSSGGSSTGASGGGTGSP